MWLEDWFLPMVHFQKQRSCSTATGLSFISMCTTQLLVCFYKKCASYVHANLLFLILLEKFGFSIFCSLELSRNILNWKNGKFSCFIWVFRKNRPMAKG